MTTRDPDPSRRPPLATRTVADAVDSLREALRREVRAATYTQRRIEEDLGWTRGYLSQVLQGHIGLSAEHLFGICSVLRIPSADLIAEAEQGPGDPISAIHQRMNEFDRALSALRSKVDADQGLGEPEPPTDSDEGGG